MTIRDVRTRWHLTETRELDASVERARLVLPVAVATATNATVQDEASPRVEMERRVTVFDRCEVSATVSDAGDERACVEATITFDISEGKVDAILALSASVVGIPFGFAWRAISIHEARMHARGLFAALWRALDDLTRGTAYR